MINPQINYINANNSYNQGLNQNQQNLNNYNSSNIYQQNIQQGQFNQSSNYGINQNNLLNSGYQNASFMMPNPMTNPMANPMVNSNNNPYNNNFSALSSNQTQFVSNPYNNFGYL
jgi:hypothetical protein